MLHPEAQHEPVAAVGGGHGFRLAPRELTPALLRTYWTIPERQIETSVVLADPPIES